MSDDLNKLNVPVEMPLGAWVLVSKVINKSTLADLTFENAKAILTIIGDAVEKEVKKLKEVEAQPEPVAKKPSPVKKTARGKR